MRIETHKNLQNVGIVLNGIVSAIPIVGSVAAFIKFLVYTGKLKGCSRAMEGTGKKIDEEMRKIRLGRFSLSLGSDDPKGISLAAAEQKLYKKLQKSVCWQMIPFWGILDGNREAFWLLPKLRKILSLKDPNQQVAFLRKEYYIKPIADPEKNQFMGKVLIAIDNLELQGSEDRKKIRSSFLFDGTTARHKLYRMCNKAYDSKGDKKPVTLVRESQKALAEKYTAVCEALEAHKPKKELALFPQFYPSSKLGERVLTYNKAFVESMKKEAL